VLQSASPACRHRAQQRNWWSHVLEDDHRACRKKPRPSALRRKKKELLIVEKMSPHSQTEDKQELSAHWPPLCLHYILLWQPPILRTHRPCKMRPHPVHPQRGRWNQCGREGSGNALHPPTSGASAPRAQVVAARGEEGTRATESGEGAKLTPCSLELASRERN